MSVHVLLAIPRRAAILASGHPSRVWIWISLLSTVGILTVAQHSVKRLTHFSSDPLA